MCYVIVTPSSLNNKNLFNKVKTFYIYFLIGNIFIVSVKYVFFFFFYL